jgi:hypothetical protein
MPQVRLLLTGGLLSQHRTPSALHWAMKHVRRATEPQAQAEGQVQQSCGLLVPYTRADTATCSASLEVKAQLVRAGHCRRCRQASRLEQHTRGIHASGKATRVLQPPGPQPSAGVSTHHHVVVIRTCHTSSSIYQYIMQARTAKQALPLFHRRSRAPCFSFISDSSSRTFPHMWRPALVGPPLESIHCCCLQPRRCAAQDSSSPTRARRADGGRCLILQPKLSALSSCTALTKQLVQPKLPLSRRPIVGAPHMYKSNHGHGMVQCKSNCCAYQCCKTHTPARPP